ncbi:MAG: RHS repeat-associated core domain-containing protein [Cyclobacteriaceae bacterium]|nr:RHS repeat-associated core domain-containing protein [Cyclobacteriaceae bacterium]
MGCINLDISYLRQAEKTEGSPFLEVWKNPNSKKPGVGLKSEVDFLGVDYYPFDLTFNSSERSGFTTNNFLYQGKELQPETETYDFHARGYDPIIGRTWQMDPHAENYFSFSPYSFSANNPLLFIDPTGKDINFYTWEKDEDGEWQRKQVAFDKLDKNVQKALEAFAKTDAGNAYLSQFAKAGDKVGSVEFKSDGKFSKHEMGFDQFDSKGAAYGTSGDLYDGKRVSFYMKINTARSDEYQNPESYAITTGHEAFIHLDQFDEELIQAIENKNSKAYFAIKAKRNRIANDRNGGSEHDGHIAGKPEYARMKGYLNQLKNVLNPVDVNKQIQKHESKLKSGK